MTHKLQLGLIAAIVMASWAAPALAIDDSSRSAARTLVNEGAAHFKEGRFEEARRKFMEAYEVAKVPTVAVWAAQAHDKLGKLVAASELYESALLMQPNELWVGNAQQQAQQKARETLKALKPRIPVLKIVLVGANASEVEVTIDNVKVPSGLLAVERPVDPGAHAVNATRGGKSVVDMVTLSLEEAEKKIITLQLPDASAPTPAVARIAPAAPPTGSRPPEQSNLVTTPASSPADSAATVTALQNMGASVSSQPAEDNTQRTLGWVGVGVGAAGLALGTTAAVVVGLKRSSMHSDGCSENTCIGTGYTGRVDSYNSWRTISTVGFVVGGLGTAAGITLLLTSPKQESAPHVGLMIDLSTVSVKGAF